MLPLTGQRNHSCVLRREHLGVLIRRVLIHPMHFYKNDVIPDKSCPSSGESGQVSTELKTQTSHFKDVPTTDMASLTRPGTREGRAHSA